MKNAVKRFVRDEDGQDLVEYVLLVGFMALGAIGLMQTQGAAVVPIWGTANTTIQSAAVATS